MPDARFGMSANLGSDGHKELVDHLSSFSKNREEPAKKGVDPVLVSKGISHNYNGIPALADVGIELYPGEIAAVVGHNGAGKSTFLRCLIGLISPASGEVLIEGELMKGRSVTDFARKVA